MGSYVLTITLNEFSIWQRMGTLRVLAVRLIPVHWSNGEVALTPEAENQIAERMPDFEEDFELMHVILETSDAPEGLIMRVGQPLELPSLDLPFQVIRSIRAISARGLLLLPGKLGPLFAVPGVLAGAATARREQERLQQQTLAGADALCSLIRVASVTGDVVAEWLPRVLAGHQARHEGAAQPKPELGFLANLMFYARRRADIERTSDIGFLQDVLALALDLAPQGAALLPTRPNEPGSTVEPLRSAVRMAVDRLRSSKEKGALPFETLMAAHALDLESVEPFIDGPGPGAAVYLKLRDVLAAGSPAEVERARELVAKLGDRPGPTAVSIGVWLTGAYYGFAHFADACYAYRRQNAPAAAIVDARSVAVDSPAAEDAARGVLPSGTLSSETEAATLPTELPGVPFSHLPEKQQSAPQLSGAVQGPVTQGQRPPKTSEPSDPSNVRGVARPKPRRGARRKAESDHAEGSLLDQSESTSKGS